MLDEKQKKETTSIIRGMINEGRMVKPKIHSGVFFLKKSETALSTSERLMQISNDEKESLECYLWVITTSYYSMFFAATSLLAHLGHKLNVDIGIHRLTYHALMYYCIIDDNKLQKHYLEQYKEAYEDAEQLLQICDTKALETVNNLRYEQDKRHSFTYEEGIEAERSKAEISLKRAREFLSAIKVMIME